MPNRRKIPVRVASRLWRSWSPAAILLPSAGLLSVVTPAVGQIYTTSGQLIPGTQGITPGPGVNLSLWNTPGHELEYANLANTNLSNASFEGSDLTNAELSASTLTYAQFTLSTLTSADLTGAIITGAVFNHTRGLAASQLYSTASYASGNLDGIYFVQDNLAGWNFADENLANAEFGLLPLTNANFTNANLVNTNFFGPILTNCIFSGATIAGTDSVAGTEFYDVTGFTPAQLYSTASYASGDLTGVRLEYDSLVSWNFANQNLTTAELTGSGLANANFTGANLTNADFADADLRGSIGWSPSNTASTQNAILPDGSIHGLALQANEELVVGNSPIPVTVETTATFDPASILLFQLDQNWTSPIAFTPGVTPALAGTLELLFASDVAPGSLLGTTFQLFNYNAPLAANNQFATTTTAPGYTFNLSNLYTTGLATLTGMPAVTVGTPTAAATMQLPSGVGLLTTSSLTVNPGSTLDITNNALAINYTPGSSPAAAIRALLATGYGDDTWTGPGIDSSVAALNPGRFAVGYADGNVDQGTAAGANQVLVEYTLAGDANLDGTVNFADLLAVAQNFNHTLDTQGNAIDWADGDFNYDGKVNFADLLLVAQNFNQTLSAGQLEQLPGSFSAAWNLALAEVQGSESDNVPEPTSAGLLLLGSAGLLTRRRRRGLAGR